MEEEDDIWELEVEEYIHIMREIKRIEEKEDVE